MYTTLVASVELDNWSYSGSGWFRTFGRGRLDLRTRALLSLLLSRTLAHKRTTSIADRVNDLEFFQFFGVFVRDFIVSGYRYATSIATRWSSTPESSRAWLLEGERHRLSPKPTMQVSDT